MANPRPHPISITKRSSNKYICSTVSWLTCLWGEEARELLLCSASTPVKLFFAICQAGLEKELWWMDCLTLSQLHSDMLFFCALASYPRSCCEQWINWGESGFCVSAEAISQTGHNGTFHSTWEKRDRSDHKLLKCLIFWLSFFTHVSMSTFWKSQVNRDFRSGRVGSIWNLKFQATCLFLLLFLLSKWFFYFFNYSCIPCFISFRCTAWWLDISITYKTITPMASVLWHHI